MLTLLAIVSNSVFVPQYMNRFKFQDAPTLFEIKTVKYYIENVD